MEYTQNGWPPDAGSLPYFSVREQLSVAEGVLLYDWESTSDPS